MKERKLLMSKKKEKNEERFNFLEAIYGEDIPEDIKTDSSNPLVTIYTLGKPNMKILARTALTLLS